MSEEDETELTDAEAGRLLVEGIESLKSIAESLQLISNNIEIITSINRK